MRPSAPDAPGPARAPARGRPRGCNPGCRSRPAWDNPSRKDLPDLADLFPTAWFPQTFQPLNRQISFIFPEHECAGFHTIIFGDEFPVAEAGDMVAWGKRIVHHSFSQPMTPYARSAVSRTVSTELVPEILSMRSGRFLSCENTT